MTFYDTGLGVHELLGLRSRAGVADEVRSSPYGGCDGARGGDLGTGWSARTSS